MKIQIVWEWFWGVYRMDTIVGQDDQLWSTLYQFSHSEMHQSISVWEQFEHHENFQKPKKTASHWRIFVLTDVKIKQKWITTHVIIFVGQALSVWVSSAWSVLANEMFSFRNKLYDMHSHSQEYSLTNPVPWAPWSYPHFPFPRVIISRKKHDLQLTVVPVITAPRCIVYVV